MNQRARTRQLLTHHHQTTLLSAEASQKQGRHKYPICLRIVSCRSGRVDQNIGLGTGRLRVRILVLAITCQLPLHHRYYSYKHTPLSPPPLPLWLAEKQQMQTADSASLYSNIKLQCISVSGVHNIPCIYSRAR